MQPALPYSAESALGQTGNVVGVNVKVDLQLATTGERLHGVSTRHLKHIRPFRPGHYVVHEDWVGRIEEARRRRTPSHQQVSRAPA